MNRYKTIYAYGINEIFYHSVIMKSLSVGHSGIKSAENRCPKQADCTSNSKIKLQLLAKDDMFIEVCSMESFFVWKTNKINIEDTYSQ